tara:strand:+ start:77 stop:355 length:279 start_codon:yes stop_codon:yes gene_type:complete
MHTSSDLMKLSAIQRAIELTVAEWPEATLQQAAKFLSDLIPMTFIHCTDEQMIESTAQVSFDRACALGLERQEQRDHQRAIAAANAPITKPT